MIPNQSRSFLSVAFFIVVQSQRIAAVLGYGGKRTIPTAKPTTTLLVVLLVHTSQPKKLLKLASETTISLRFPQSVTKAPVIPYALPQRTFVVPLPFLWWLATPTRSWHLKILFSCVDSHSLHKGEFSRASQFWGIRTFILSRNPYWVCLSFHLGTFSSYVDLYEIFFILYSGS